jgi:hypothetical protein
MGDALANNNQYIALGYFPSLELSANKIFVDLMHELYGFKYVITDKMESAYTGIRMWAAAVQAAGTFVPRPVLHQLWSSRFPAPSGHVQLDGSNYLAKQSRLGTLDAQGTGFRITNGNNSAFTPKPFWLFPGTGGVAEDCDFKISLRTICMEGKGLVNENGLFLQSWDGAFGCDWCAPGSHSIVLETLGEAPTRICSPCAAGSIQVAPGQDECTACSAGRFSAMTGQTVCEPCETGTYSSTVAATECIACRPKETTLKMAKVQGKDQMILFWGAASETDCGCEPGARPEGGECVSCGVGLKCYGRNDTYVAEGYYAGEDFSVYKCHDDIRKCPGGRAGDSCAAGREGISCSECMPGKSAQGDGTCGPCQGPDTFVFVLAVVGFLLVTIFIYWVIDTKDHTKQSHAILLIAMAFSVTLTIVQQIGIVGVFAMDWPQPLATMFKILRLLTFDVEVIRLGCVVSPDAFGRFAVKVLIIAIGIALLCIIHVCFVVARHRGNFAKQLKSLTGSLGTLFMVFFTSLVSTIVGPFQCLLNPNGAYTARSYQAVVCWTSEGDHTAMVILGAVALLVPAGFLAHCIFIVRSFPEKMRKGDADFLLAYAYLFFRYRVEVYWYSLVHMLRSVILAFIPIVPDVVIQIIVMQMLTVAHFALTIFIQPWRIGHANFLESAFLCGVLLILAIGAFFVDDLDKESLAYFGASILTAMLLALPALVSYGVYTHFCNEKYKPFQFFICHHKAGAGCLARLLKCALSADSRIVKKVFLDSDDLQSLDKLFDYVGFMTDTCLAACSKELLQRQWCMGELVTAKLNNVHVVRIVLQDFVDPTPTFIDHYAETVDISGLAEHGISIEQLQETLRWIMVKTTLVVPGSLSEKTLQGLIDELVARQRTSHMFSQELSFRCNRVNPSAKFAILVDHCNYEAEACALVLRMYLAKHFVHSPNDIPFVLPKDEPVPDTIRSLLIMCTRGALQQPEFLKSLMQAAQNSVKHLPILADESFRFPTQSFILESKLVVSALTDKLDDLAKLIQQVFKEIAVVFQPEQYSSTEEVLQIKSKQIAKRLADGDSSAMKNSNSLYFPPGELMSAFNPDAKLTTGASLTRASPTGSASSGDSVNDVGAPGRWFGFPRMSRTAGVVRAVATDIALHHRISSEKPQVPNTSQVTNLGDGSTWRTSLDGRKLEWI